MLYAGSDDGIYEIPLEGSAPQHVLESDRAMRLRRFPEIEGVFAATRSGLFHSPDGETWSDLDVPEESVYAVGTDSDQDRILAGTRPAALYVTPTASVESGDGPKWRELDGFQDLPSRAEWRLPRHENLAQVRDIHSDPESRDRLVAGVEVGGVHVSDDGGTTWRERREGVNDDVHELRVAGPGEYVAATGYGLFHTSDSGRSWSRLDEDVSQGYFRSLAIHDGVVYASGALSNSSTWNDPDADPALYAVRSNGLEQLPLPRDNETVTGMTNVEEHLVVATHRGSVFLYDDGEWAECARVPVPGEVTGRYTPLTTFSR
jgi:hypothetical protein